MTRRLSVAPDPVLRDGIYIRVSAIMGRTDDRFLSPEIQREAIDRARGRGPASTVVQEWRDIDVSTAKVKAADRPGLQAALKAARAGDIDRLWVLTLDRFDRDTSALRTFDEITALGVQLWTEAGPLDVESPEGYLSVSMQLAIARYQRDRIGKSWRQTHQHRLERGLTHSGKARYGYIYDKEQHIHVVDPVTGPILAECYRRYIAGETVYSMIRWLNGEGYKTQAGLPWSDHTLRRLMDTGFAAGVLTYGDAKYEGIHEKLITKKEWEQFCAARDSRRRSSNRERSQYLLSGLLRCACGSSMTAGQFGEKQTPKYRCSAAKESGRHLGGYVMAHYIERAVTDWLTDIASDLDAAIDLASAAQRKTTKRSNEASKLRREISDLENQLIKLTVDLASGVVPEVAYLPARDLIAAKRNAKAEQLQEVQRAAAAPKSERPQAAAAALLRDWDLLPITQRREALKRLIKVITVTPGRPRAIIEITPLWQ